MDATLTTTDLAETIRRTIRDHAMLAAGDTVVVAVSGGADSVALAHLLAGLRSEWRLTLHIAHLNHALRPDAGDDARFVRQVAESLDIPITIETVDVAALARRERRSLEDAGRVARYSFFSALAERLGVTRVATAHTWDDQVETVVMRLLQGGNWEMLAGIPPVRSLGRAAVIRPLRRVKRETIRRHLRDRDLAHRDDPTNRDRRILRNRIRLDVLPALPATTADLCWALGELARETDVLLHRLAEAFYGHFSIRGVQSVRFPREEFRTLPEPLQRRLIRLAIAGATGTPQPVSVVIERKAVRAAQTAATGREVTVGRAVLRIGYDTVEVVVTGPTPAPGVYRLTLSGETRAEAFGLVFNAEVVEGPASPGEGAHEATFDAACTGTDVVIRAWRPGDRFRPLGGRGKKKVADYFIDRKVPRWDRPRIPLLVDARGRVLWIVGHRASSECAVSERTHRVLRLRAHPA